MSADPGGGFGGVPKDDIWGHPKPGGFGGTQMGGSQVPGMMSPAPQAPQGPNPYQQQYAPEPKANMDSFSFQPNPPTVVSSALPPQQHQPPTRQAPAFQETFGQPPRPMQGSQDFRFGMQPEAVRGFEAEGRAVNPGPGQSGLPQQPRQETWPQTPPSFSNQYAQPGERMQGWQPPMHTGSHTQPSDSLQGWQQPTHSEFPGQGPQGQFQPPQGQFMAPQPGFPQGTQDFPGAQQASFAQPGQMGAFQPSMQPPQETKQCTCGQTAALLTVKKEGPNMGRNFWKCASCGAFDWADEPPRSGQPNQLPPQVADGPPCFCGQPSLGLTVRKDGPNQGRPFYGCAQRGCQFFQWGDEQPPPPGPPCLCGVASAQRKVAKEGPNKGRPFSAAASACDRMGA